LSIIVFLCLAVLAWRIVARFILLAPTEYTYMATDCRIDSILYGALLRTLFETPWAEAAIRMLRTRSARLLALLTLLATLLIRDDDFRETIRYSIQGLALMPIFTAVLSDPSTAWHRRFLSNGTMVLIGRLSYSIYLLHLFCRTPGEAYFGSIYDWGPTISGLVLTGAAAYGIYIFIERPLALLRRRFRATSATKSEPAPLLAPTGDALPHQPAG
jgi:peptidoglycan/LPS O-acetylase OafA/YrhL